MSMKPTDKAMSVEIEKMNYVASASTVIVMLVPTASTLRARNGKCNCSDARVMLRSPQWIAVHC
jgi:hypothetical protein